MNVAGDVLDGVREPGARTEPEAARGHLVVAARELLDDPVRHGGPPEPLEGGPLELEDGGARVQRLDLRLAGVRAQRRALLGVLRAPVCRRLVDRREYRKAAGVDSRLDDARRLVVERRVGRRGVGQIEVQLVGDRLVGVRGGCREANQATEQDEEHRDERSPKGHALDLGVPACRCLECLKKGLFSLPHGLPVHFSFSNPPVGAGCCCRF